MKPKFLISFLLFYFSYAFCFSQQINGDDLGSYKKNFKEGCLLFNENNKILALKYFQNAYQYDSSNSNINYLIGVCFFNLENKKQFAERYLQKAIKHVTKNYRDSDPAEKKAPVLAFMYMAKSFLFSYKFSEAEEMLALFDAQMKKKDEIARIESEATKNQIKYARIFYNSPSTDVDIQHLGNKLNSIYPEFSTVVSPDERMLFFAFRGKNNEGSFQVALDGYPFEDVFISYKLKDGSWSDPKSISPNINTSSAEIPVGISFDSQTLILQKDDLGDVNLYYSNWDGHDWTLPNRFGSNINTEFVEGGACFSLDKNVIYFSSNRPGGFGGMDIYRSVKLPNGEWSLAQNLGPSINTALNEDSPVITADGKIFYFSSAGHQSMGGYDAMYSVLDEEGNFSNPINLGFPLNTSDDELCFFPTFDNHRLYFSSSREKSLGEKDIFLATKRKSFPVNVSLLNCALISSECDSFPENILLRVTDLSTGQKIGEFRPHKENGAFSVILPPAQIFDFTFYRDSSRVFSEQFEFPYEYSNESLTRNYRIKRIGKNCEDFVIELDSAMISNISLDLFVLNNPKDKKPIEGLKAQIQQDSKESYVSLTDIEGKVKFSKIKNGDRVKINFIKDDKSSDSFYFQALTDPNSNSFQKYYYLDEIFPEPGKLVNKDLPTKKEKIKVDPKIFLNLKVLDTKTSKLAIPNSEVKITGTDGSTLVFNSDKNGKVNEIPLKKNVNYEIAARASEKKSSSVIVSTEGISKDKIIQKSIFLSDEQEVVDVADNSERKGNSYKFYFKYNMNQLDVEASAFKDFILAIDKIYEEKGAVNLKIKASSSTVPSKKYKSNKTLSEKRLKKSLELLFAKIQKEGINTSSVKVIQKKAIVSGPKFDGDSYKKSKYEKYQYVSIEAF